MSTRAGMSRPPSAASLDLARRLRIDPFAAVPLQAPEAVIRLAAEDYRSTA